MEIKKICYILFPFISALSLFSGCRSSENKTVNLSVWTDIGYSEAVSELLEDFKSDHKDSGITFNFDVVEQNVSSSFTAMSINPENGGDLFMFPDDQLILFVKEGIIDEITENVSEIIEMAGGNDQQTVKSAVLNGHLYAYPCLSSNGCFLYYDKSFFTEKDVEHLDEMLEKADKSGVKICWDLQNGWYLYSFFKAAGMNVSYNEAFTENKCDWNRKTGEFKGIDVAEKITEIACHDSFFQGDDSVFLELAESKIAVAGISGTWLYKDMKNIWRGNLGMSKLPQFNLKGKNIQLRSFSGFKYFGVSSYSKNKIWAHETALFLTSPESQKKLYLARKEAPSAVSLKDDPEINAAPQIKALKEQALYSDVQEIQESYWKASKKLGIKLSSGHPEEFDLQKLLDEAVSEIETPVK